MIRISAGRSFSFLAFVVACCFVVAATKPANAVIISGVDGTTNTTAPIGVGNDPGFANVGARPGADITQDASGVYLGNGWVLTANHVGVGPIVLGGNTYTVMPSTTHRLKTPDLSAFTDLVLYKINGDPGLPSITISSSAPATGSTVTMIGNGWNRAANTTYWNVDMSNVWTELMGPAGAEASGYKWDTSGRTIRWGRNVITNPPPTWTDQLNVPGNGVVNGLYTIFDSSGVQFEAHAAKGDSGGAVFYKNGGNWELVGLMHLITTFTGQPGNTAVFGNYTFFSNLSLYQPQIMAIVPEPTAGLLAAVAGVGLLALRLRRRRSML